MRVVRLRLWLWWTLLVEERKGIGNSGGGRDERVGKT
jgi:hypothetical protein